MLQNAASDRSRQARSPVRGVIRSQPIRFLSGHVFSDRSMGSVSISIYTEFYRKKQTLLGSHICLTMMHHGLGRADLNKQ